MKKGRRVTIMFMVVSFGACVVYLPTLVLKMLWSFGLADRLLEHMNDWYKMLVIFYSLNHAINPIVFGFLDDRFRQKCKHMYLKLAGCSRK